MVSTVDIKNKDGSNYREKEIEVKNDITLINKDNSIDVQGLEAMMKAGLYQVLRDKLPLIQVFKK